MFGVATRPIDTSHFTLTEKIALVVLCVVIMTICAKTQVPFWPVPMTLQTMATMAFAILLGPRLSVVVMLAYLAAGAIGLPVFSGTPERGVGLAYMLGPTGGYLVGHLFASGFVGVFAQGKRFTGVLLVMTLGLLLIYGSGLGWLAGFVPRNRLVATGIMPFLIGDLFKIGIVGAAASLRPEPEELDQRGMKPD